MGKAHLTNLNLNIFKMIEAMELKLLHQGPAEWYYLRIKFHEIYQAVQKLLVGDTQTDSQFGMIEVTFNVITTIQHFI
jgi:hypothetical protein